MKRSLAILLLPVLAVYLGGCLSDDLRGGLEGVITDTVTEEPLVGVLVACESLKNNRVVTGTTDGEGRYEVSDATYGLNEVTMTLEGYYEREALADIEQDHAISADFTLTRILDRRDLNLSVEVQDQQGAPVSAASVAVYRRDQDEFGGVGYADTLLSTSRTDAVGRAYFIGLDSLVEREILFLRTDVAAWGYQNATSVTTVSYESPNQAFRITLTPLP